MESKKCKWKREAPSYRYAQDNLCTRHAPVIVSDSRRICGDDFFTTYPDAACPCGDYKEDS